MSFQTLMISAEGLRNIVFTTNSSESNFRFIAGENEIQMNNLLADFISPRVSRIHHADPTIDSFNLNTLFRSYDQSVKFFDSKLIENFKLISTGYPIKIDEKTSQSLRFLSILIGNNDMYTQINKLFPLNETDSNIEKSLYVFEYFDSFNNSDFFHPLINDQESLDLLSKHFYSIEKEKFFKLPKSILYSIICNDKLTLSSEDSLLDFIDEIFTDCDEENDGTLNKAAFYEQVHFDLLSEKKFREFIEKLESNDMTNIIWRKLKECFNQQYQRKDRNSSLRKRNSRCILSNEEKKIEVKFDGEVNNRFNGIISKLSNGNPKNIVNLGLIDVTSSSCASDYECYKPAHAVDFSSQKSFWSENFPNSWLCYDFKNRKVKPTHYSIKSNYYDGVGWNHLQNWCIEGSNDQDDWKILDERNNEKCLDGRGFSSSFEIQKKLDENEFYRYLRIRQTGLNTRNAHYLTLTSLEYFGTIIE